MNTKSHNAMNFLRALAKELGKDVDDAALRNIISRKLDKDEDLIKIDGKVCLNAVFPSPKHNIIREKCVAALEGLRGPNKAKKEKAQAQTTGEKATLTVDPQYKNNPMIAATKPSSTVDYIKNLEHSVKMLRQIGYTVNCSVQAPAKEL